MRRSIAQFGRKHIYGWGLSRPDDIGESLSGEALVDLALQPASPST